MSIKFAVNINENEELTTNIAFLKASTNEYEECNSLDENGCQVQHPLDNISHSVPLPYNVTTEVPYQKCKGPSEKPQICKLASIAESSSCKDGENERLINSARNAFHHSTCPCLDNHFQYDLLEREKQLKCRREQNEQNRRDCMEILRQANNMMNCATQNPNHNNLRVGDENEVLSNESRRIIEETEATKLQLRQCMEQVEKPFCNRLADRRRKSEQLQNDLRLVISALDLQRQHVQNVDTLQGQLNCTCRNVDVAKSTNRQLNQDLCMLAEKYKELEKDIEQEKISETQTLKSGLCIKQAMGDYEEMGKKNTCENFKNDSLEELARRISRSLLKIEKCHDCKTKLSEDLKETVKGIKQLLDLIHLHGLKEEKLLKSPASAKPGNDLKITQSTTTSLAGKIDDTMPSLTATSAVDLENESNITASSVPSIKALDHALTEEEFETCTSNTSSLKELTEEPSSKTQLVEPEINITTEGRSSSVTSRKTVSLTNLNLAQSTVTRPSSPSRAYSATEIFKEYETSFNMDVTILEQPQREGEVQEPQEEAEDTSYSVIITVEAEVGGAFDSKEYKQPQKEDTCRCVTTWKEREEAQKQIKDIKAVITVSEDKKPEKEIGEGYPPITILEEHKNIQGEVEAPLEEAQKQIEDTDAVLSVSEDGKAKKEIGDEYPPITIVEEHEKVQEEVEVPLEEAQKQIEDTNAIVSISEDEKPEKEVVDKYPPITIAEEHEKVQLEVEVTSKKEALTDIDVEVETETDLDDESAENVNIIIATITESGKIEIVTEHDDTIVESIITYSKSGNVNISTEIIQYPDESEFLSESELESPISSTSFVIMPPITQLPVASSFEPSSIPLSDESSFVSNLTFIDKHTRTSEDTAYPAISVTPSVSGASRYTKSSIEIESESEIGSGETKCELPAKIDATESIIEQQTEELVTTSEIQEVESKQLAKEYLQIEVEVLHDETEETLTVETVLAVKIEEETAEAENQTVLEVVIEERHPKIATVDIGIGVEELQSAVECQTPETVTSVMECNIESGIFEMPEGSTEALTKTSVVESRDVGVESEIFVMSENDTEASVDAELYSAVECRAPVSEDSSLMKYEEIHESEVFEIAENSEEESDLEAILSALQCIECEKSASETTCTVCKSVIEQLMEVDLSKSATDPEVAVELFTTTKSQKELDIAVTINHEKKSEIIAETESKTKRIYVIGITPTETEANEIEFQIEITEETKSAIVAESIDETPFIVEDIRARELHKHVEEALDKANKLVMDTLFQTHINITEALEKVNKNVESVLALSLKETPSRANKQVSTEEDVLRHSTVLELVPRGAEGKMVPLRVSVSRRPEEGVILNEEEQQKMGNEKDGKGLERSLSWPSNRSYSIGAGYYGSIYEKHEEKDIPRMPVFASKAPRSAEFACNDVCGRSCRNRLEEAAKPFVRGPGKYFASESDLELGSDTEEETTFIHEPQWQEFTEESKQVEQALYFEIGEESEKELIFDLKELPLSDKITPSSVFDGKVTETAMPSKVEEVYEGIAEPAFSVTDTDVQDELTFSFLPEETVAKEEEVQLTVTLVIENDVATLLPETVAKEEKAQPVVFINSEEAATSFTEAVLQDDATVPGRLPETVAKEQEPELMISINAEKTTSSLQTESVDADQKTDSKPGGLSAEMFSPDEPSTSRKSEEESMKSSRRSRASQKSFEREKSQGMQEEHAVIKTPLLEEIECNGVGRQSVATEQTSSRKRSKSSSDQKSVTRSSRSSRKSSVKTSEEKSKRLDSVEATEGKSKSLQQVPRPSQSKSSELEEARKADHTADVHIFEAKRSEIKCDCKECECEICSLEKMKEREKKQNGAKLDQPEDCTCLPDCGCAACASLTPELKVHGEIKPSGDAIDQKVQSPRKLSEILNKREVQQIHPLDCECLDCLCDPPFSLKNFIEPRHPEQCDCLFCRCCTCSSDPDEKAKNIFFPPAGLHDSVITETLATSTISNVVSDSRTLLSESVTKKLSIVQMPYSSNISEESKNACSYTEVISLHNSTNHSANCDCFDCLNTATLATSKTRLSEHPDNCNCSQSLHTICLTPNEGTPGENIIIIDNLEKEFHDQNRVDSLNKTTSKSRPSVKDTDHPKSTEETPKENTISTGGLETEFNNQTYFDCLNSATSKAGSSIKDTEHPKDCNCSQCLQAVCPTPTLEIPEENIISASLDTEVNNQKQNIIKLQEAIKQAACMCRTAEEQASCSTPLEKSFVAVQKSSFRLTLSGLRMAICALQDKCKQKDKMIAIMTDELVLRANDTILGEFFDTLSTQNVDEDPVDFDRTEICKSLPRPRCDPQYGSPSNQLKEPIECKPCSHPDYPNCPCTMNVNEAVTQPILQENDTEEITNARADTLSTSSPSDYVIGFEGTISLSISSLSSDEELTKSPLSGEKFTESPDCIDFSYILQCPYKVKTRDNTTPQSKNRKQPKIVQLFKKGTSESVSSCSEHNKHHSCVDYTNKMRSSSRENKKSAKSTAERSVKHPCPKHGQIHGASSKQTKHTCKKHTKSSSAPKEFKNTKQGQQGHVRPTINIVEYCKTSTMKEYSKLEEPVPQHSKHGTPCVCSNHPQKKTHLTGERKEIRSAKKSIKCEHSKCVDLESFKEQEISLIKRAIGCPKYRVGYLNPRMWKT